MNVSEGSSSAAGIYDYDVFLSFQGLDCRNLAEILYDSLEDAGVRVFRDEDVRRGEEIFPSILEAIRRSRIYIPVFSKNYASSKWCLEEVAQIFLCRESLGSKIFPVYYCVYPHDVRTQMGEFGVSFTEHERRGTDPAKIEIWRQALHKVASLKGWELDDQIGSKHIKRIVSHVLQSLCEDISSIPMDVSEGSSSVEGMDDYDVFLNFGSDTGTGFADLLYHGLKDAGVLVFRWKDVPVGEEMPGFVLQAIERSRISIPIFSEDYASSAWRLDELVQMVESRKSQGQRIFPIFYRVDPRDVRHQTGTFAKSIDDHERSSRFQPDRINIWRQALRYVANLSGWYADYDWSTSAVVKVVICKVREALNKDKLALPKNLVGLEDHVDAVMKLLDVSAGGKRIIGIYGMKGAGKTTIAKAVYNHLCHHSFRGYAFLMNIREACKINGLHHLQQQLVSQVLMQRHVQFKNHDEGIRFIRARLCNKRVIVVLDDVDSDEQLDALAGSPDWFGEGSRIIITTRRIDILRAPKVFQRYEVEPMREREALKLFCLHAFAMDFPPDGYYDLSVGFIFIIGGIPLHLAVMGSMLCGRKKHIWEGILQELQETSASSIFEKWLISIDTLKHQEKEIFLDIACFLTGKDVRVAFYMWEDCGLFPYHATQSLCYQSLLEIGNNHELKMSDELKSLGREFVQMKSPNELGNRSRLWHHDEAVEVLKRREGTKHVEALCLTFGDDSCNSFTSLEFDGFSNLRFLKLGRASMEGNFGDCLSNLMWLDWEGCKKLDDILKLHLKNILILDLSKSQVTADAKAWNEVMKMSHKLRVLLLNGCSNLCISPSFPLHMRLKMLSLENCSGLTKLHSSIGNLKELEYLNLKFCVRIDHLPEELGLLEHLKELLIDGTSIRKLHFAEGSMVQLEILSACSCKSLDEISESIGHLKSLKILRLDNNIIEKLPSSISLLEKLEVLSLKNCPKLHIPMSQRNLKSILHHSEIGELLSISDLENEEALQKEKKICRSSGDTKDASFTDMNSGTSASPFEVVLSFNIREEAGCLFYEHMEDAGIRVFGIHKLPVEEKDIDGEFMRAISNSVICIPFFTKDYPCSTQCLRQLAYIMEPRVNVPRQQVLPIFYDVEPSDLKLETDLYINALRVHEHNFAIEEVQHWKEALRKVAELEGWKFKAEGFKRYGKSAVIAILSKLKEKHQSVLVGMQDQVEKLKKILDVESRDILFVGIHGIGGIGKTTLAKAVFEQLSTNFEGYSFLRDIRETSKHKGLKHLSDQLLRDINCASTDCETKTTSHIFLEKKVLIVLDDVDERGQIKKLVGKSNRFVSGSRIIVTTRDIDVLAVEHETIDGRILEWPEEVRLFEMEEMKSNEALQLLSCHAFGEVHPPDGYLHICEEVVYEIGRLPLALEIIGSFLNHKHEHVWKVTLEKLKKLPDRELHTQMMISYESLDNETKEIFLDIACFFIGQEKTTPIYMWDACELLPELGIDALTFLSFVKILGGNRLWMHNEVRDFGRKIIYGGFIVDSAKYSRLWVNEEVMEILRSKEVNENAQGLRLCFDEFLQDYTFPPEELGSLPNLRFLELSRFPFSLKRALPKLRWLAWHFCLQHVKASDLYLENLVILDLSNSYVSDQLGESGQLQMAKSLKVLNLTNCKRMTRTPIFSDCMILERLILEGCENLVKIDSSIGNLRHLMYLNLKGCHSLEELPNELGSTTTLTELIIRGNGQSFKLQESLIGLTSLSVLEIDNVKIADPVVHLGNSKMLKQLTLSECSGIKKLTEFSQFSLLTNLDISGSDITRLPDSIKEMKNLKVINMESSLIIELPNSIGHLGKLEELHAKKCRCLHGEIPSEIGTLSSLEVLDLSYTRISSLPSTLSQLSNLQTLNLECCDELEKLPELPKSLISLRIMCVKLQSLPHLFEMNSLRDLQLFCALDEFQVDWFEKLSRLEKLELCIPRINILKFGDTSQLRSLSVSCRDIETLAELPSTLSRLCLANLKKGTKLSSLYNLKSLTFIEFYNCSVGDDDFKSVGAVYSLEHLSASKCNFSSCNELPLPEKLRVLSLRECELPGLLELQALKILLYLELIDCQVLTEIRGLEKLESLEEINICNCSSLKTLGDLSGLERLKALRIDSCEVLKDVKGLERMTSLKHLQICRCELLESLPGRLKIKKRRRKLLTYSTLEEKKMHTD